MTTVTLTGVPQTLLLTTRARVEEHQRPDGILQDPKAVQWFQDLPWYDRLDTLYTPLSQLGWAVRAYQIDQITQQFLAKRKAALVVELGSGLSTRYFRIAREKDTWFEVDLPEVIDLRLQVDQETSTHRFYRGSVLDLGWMESLPEFQSEDMLFLAEGLLMYFSQSEVQTLLKAMQQQFSGSTLALDVVGGLTRGQAARKLADLGAPLGWFVRNEQDLVDMGLSVTQVLSLIQCNQRYPDRIGMWRWLPWLSRLPAFRNACLIVEAKL